MTDEARRRYHKEYYQKRRQYFKEANQKRHQEHKDEDNTRNLAYYHQNAERLQEQNALWRSTHVEQVRQTQKTYHQEHKDEIAKKQQEYLQHHVEERSEYNHQYHITHYDIILRNHRLYYLRHKEEDDAKHSLYQKEHPEISQVGHEQYRARLFNSEGSFTVDEFRQKCLEYNNSCAYCKQECESLTVDHVIPLSKGGSNYISNIVPACLSCNSKKRDLSVDEFLLRLELPQENKLT